MINRLLTVILMLSGLAYGSTASAEVRIALVIGNGQYANSLLTNPTRDARLIRDTLKTVGFSVRYVENADRVTMVRDIHALGRDLATAGPDSVGLLYFRGYGAQSDGRNYLLPVGGQIDTEVDLLLEAVDANWVLKQLEKAGNALNIIVLDACRANTPAVARESASSGWARMLAPVGSLVAFSSESGTCSNDPTDPNNPYATQLSRFMLLPGLELKTIFDEAARSVYDETRDEPVPQIPTQFYKLPPNFFFKTTPGAGSVAPDRPETLSGKATVPPVSTSVSRDCSDCPEMVRIPGGTFRMGDLSGKGDLDEKPVHEVSIRPFSVGKYQVTFAEWDACVAAGGCSKWPLDEGWGRGNRPVINVNWDDAQQYVKWLSEKTGKRYRLLTESEREYVGRAGTTTEYSFGNCITTEHANHDGNDDFDGCGKTGKYLQRTAAAGTYPANAWGLHDLHGNVWEWTEDCWHDSYSGAPTDGTAWTSGRDCTWRVVRGGSWGDYPQGLRSANRLRRAAAYALNNQGFRLSRTD